MTNAITLDNTADGGTQSISLDFVISYDLREVERYGIKNVPGKSTSTIDTDTFVVNPRRFEITARVTDGVRSLLQQMRKERKTIDLSDGVESNVDTRIESLNFRGVAGNISRPWIVIISLLEKT